MPVHIKVPPSWTENEMAGEDWAERFMKRHPMISLRTPEATSLQRMACFNKYNVNSFYDNLSTVMEEKSFTPDRIYNCDEKGVTTVQRPTKQIAETGAKRVGSVVSQERGALVTVCCSVNAIGNRIPPFCVFLRVCTLDVWQENLPTGSAGEGHPKASGWMTAENFLSFLNHFSK